MPESNKAAVTAIFANLAIAAAKFTAFLFTRSSAMLSETIHSVVDAGNSSLLVLGHRLARRPADETHPFGHGKEIYFWSLLVALFVFLFGGAFSVFEGIRHLRHPEPIEHPIWSYVTLALAFVFESYSFYVGIREFHHAEGVAPSWRAIHRSKDPSNFTVIFEDLAALFGLLAAFVGTLIAQLFHLPAADGLASVVIGLLLMGVAVLLIVESRALLVGEGADPETLRSIREIAERQPGVLRAGYPMTMYFGPDTVLLTMRIRLEQTLTRDGIESAIDCIEAAIRQRFPKIHHIYIEADALSSTTRPDISALPPPPLAVSPPPPHP
jgi:cation diffusion facilitator family transporter